MKNPKNEIIVVTGQRGCGKSSFIHSVLSQYDRVIIFDLLGDFTYIETTTNLKDFFNALTLCKNSPFFTLNYYNPKNSEEDFIVICKAINRMNDVMFIIDELDYFCSSNYIPKELAEIIKRGRHQELNLIIATRRPHEIPRLVTSQLTDFVTFRHIEPRDLEYIKDISGMNQEEVKQLANFEYLHYNGQKTEKGKVSRPKHKEEKISLDLNEVDKVEVDDIDETEDFNFSFD